MTKNKNDTFMYFTMSLFVFLFISPLLREGLFMDGLLYAGMARNIAEGTGSIWRPFLSNGMFPTFYEHPPLALYLESFAFKIFGDRYISVAFYNLCHFLIAFGIIFYLWKEIFPKINYRLSWIPLLSWLSLLITCWAYTNNMLEVTSTSFVLLSFFCLYHSLHMKKLHQISLYLCASIFILCGFLSKGPVALFPLSTLMIHWLVYRQQSFLKSLTSTFYLCLILAVVSSLFFYFNSAARESTLIYLQSQLFASIFGSRTGVFVGIKRFYILQSIFQKFIPLLFVSIYFFWKEKIPKSVTKSFSFYFLMGTAGSLPICFSSRQADFYALPAYPFYLIGFLSIITPAILEFLNKVPQEPKLISYWYKSTVCLFAISIGSLFFTTSIPKRDKNLIHDLKIMQNHIPKGTVLQCPPNILHAYHLHGYLAFYLHSGMENKDHKHFITYDNLLSTLPKDRQKLTLNTKSLALFVTKTKTNTL